MTAIDFLQAMIHQLRRRAAELANPARLEAAMRAAGFAEIVMHQRTHEFILRADILSADHPMMQQNPLVSRLDGPAHAAVAARALQTARELGVGHSVIVPGTARLATAEKAAHSRPLHRPVSARQGRVVECSQARTRPVSD